jgi:hypothetical protein
MVDKNTSAPAAAVGSFADLASIKGNTVVKPKNLPDGYYSVIIKGPFKEHRAKSGNFAMRFPLEVVEPMPDVDSGALADPEIQKSLKREYTIDFWMSPDARWRFTEFATSMGVDTTLDLISMAEELVKQRSPFIVKGTNEADQNDPERVFFRLDNAAPMSKYRAAG